MQSSRVRLMLVALFGVLALGALTAAAAQAVEAPRWSIAGKTLELKANGEPETHFISAKIYTTKEFTNRFTLTAVTGQIISCLAVKLKEGSLLGTAAGNGGKNDEVLEFYGNCEVKNNGSACKVTEPIVTNNVKSELVLTEKAEPAKEKGSLLTLFEAENTSIGFVTLHFTGTCTIKEAIVSGKVAGQVLVDPENGTLGEKLVELPKVNSTEAKSWLINFPKAPITRVGRIKGGVLTEENIALTVFGEPGATLSGTTLVLLAKREANGLLVSEETKWSPLP